MTRATSGAIHAAVQAGRLVMTEVQIHPVQPDWKARALIDDPTYRRWYEQSISDPDAF